jgi:hypothetical protein
MLTMPIFSLKTTRFQESLESHIYSAERRQKLLQILIDDEPLNRLIFEASTLPKEFLSSYLEEITSRSANKEWVDFQSYYRSKDGINKFLEDLASITKGPPIYRSVRGIASGVTFIDGGPSKVVLKWTYPLESVCQRIYDTFLKIIQDPALHTPKASDISRKRIPEVKWLEQPSPTHPLDTPPSCLMLYEKAPGATLIDLIAVRYNFLTQEQKFSLFIYIGKIAMLDLILGHQDRFFKLDLPLRTEKLRKMDEDYGKYANLGNILINIQKDTLHFYLIDNGAYIYDENIKYLTPFFRKSHDPKTSSRLIQIMTEQILEALKRADFPSEITEEISESLAAFEADLHTHKFLIEKGIRDVTKTIQQRFQIAETIKAFKNLKPAFRHIPKMGKFLGRVNACLIPPSPHVEDRALEEPFAESKRALAND